MKNIKIKNKDFNNFKNIPEQDLLFTDYMKVKFTLMSHVITHCILGDIKCKLLLKNNLT